MRYKDRNYFSDIILLPGWATDTRIFDNLDIEYNYYLPENFDPYKFEQECLDLLKTKDLKSISLYGWSMGGFCAADFASKHPDKVNNLILVSVKEKYDEDGIGDVKTRIDENRRAYLYKFYLECFSKEEKPQLEFFRKNILKDYLEKFTTEELVKGLKYLLETPLNLEKLIQMKISFTWGSMDKIVPVKEVIDLKNKLPNAEFNFISNRGHIPFA